MKQLQIFGANDLRLVEVAVPQCGADDVIVDVAACGVCGSDLGYVASGGLGAAQHGLCHLAQRLGVHNPTRQRLERDRAHALGNACGLGFERRLNIALHALAILCHGRSPHEK